MNAVFETIRFPVAGMTCGSCVNRITRALKRLDGVERVRVDLRNEAVTVRRDPDLVTNTTLAAAIVDAGYAPDVEAAVGAGDADFRGPLARLFGR